MANDNGAKPRRNTALIVSLCVNFFLIGILVAGVLGAIHRFRTFGGPQGDGLDPRAVIHMLPDARRDEIEPLLEGKRDQIRPLLDAARDAREDAYRIFKAETFDRAAFDAAMTKVREADAAVASATQAIIGDVAARLTADERGRIARGFLERRLEHFRERGFGRGGPFRRFHGRDDGDAFEEPVPPPPADSPAPGGD